MAIKKVEHHEGEDFQLVAYLAMRDDNPITQAGVDSITVNVFDLDAGTPSTPIFTDASIVISTSVFDTEQTDGYATRAGLTRYNFRPPPIAVGDAALTTGRRYRVEYILENADIGGGDLVTVTDVSVIGGYSV